MEKPMKTRRDVIRVGSVIFASGAMSALPAFLTGCGSAAGSGNLGNVSTPCLQSTNVTRGPFFLDEKIDPNISGDVVDSTITKRSDIRADTKGTGGVQAGVPLHLTIIVGSFSGGSCMPIAGAQVDVWHCNAQGAYSDVTTLTAENFLRGYQNTDSNGEVIFTTIYPGWYTGRAVHIHVKVRIFDTSGNVTTEATTQLFFDDAISSAVYAADAAYARSAARDTLNAADSIYAAESPALLLTLSGTPATSYAGTVSIGINVGTLYGG